ncbi:ferrochelatase [Myxococcota bacterium]|nr:ferrochelatase [Myxococcota bacterium]
MSEVRRRAAERLRTVDHAIDGIAEARATLARDRSRAHTLVDVFERLTPSLAEPAIPALADAIARVAEAFVRDFPENIFWDFDYLAGQLAKDGDVAALEARTRDLVALSAGFGRHSPIRFRYAHDFLFGFDWCRWVAREPSRRTHVGPFDDHFITYLSRRGGELAELIARDDAKYGQLRGPGFRNPFVFSREPDEEHRLHVALAERELVPVEAWRVDGRAQWQQPFAELREAVAAELGMTKRTKRGG